MSTLSDMPEPSGPAERPDVASCPDSGLAATPWSHARLSVATLISWVVADDDRTRRFISMLTVAGRQVIMLTCVVSATALVVVGLSSWLGSWPTAVVTAVASGIVALVRRLRRARRGL